jgi:hypothetical protein
MFAESNTFDQMILDAVSELGSMPEVMPHKARVVGTSGGIIYSMELQISFPPHSSVWIRLLDPVGRCLTPEVAQYRVALQVAPQSGRVLRNLPTSAPRDSSQPTSVPSTKPMCRHLSLLRCYKHRLGAS